MIRFNKDYNSKIISILIAFIFGFEAIAYSISDAEYNKVNLRVPSASVNNYERIAAAQKEAKTWSRTKKYLSTGVIVSSLFIVGYSLYVYHQVMNNPTFSVFFAKKLQPPRIDESLDKTTELLLSEKFRNEELASAYQEAKQTRSFQRKLALLQKITDEQPPSFPIYANAVEDLRILQKSMDPRAALDNYLRNLRKMGFRRKEDYSSKIFINLVELYEFLPPSGELEDLLKSSLSDYMHKQESLTYGDPQRKEYQTYEYSAKWHLTDFYLRTGRYQDYLGLGVNDMMNLPNDVLSDLTTALVANGHTGLPILGTIGDMVSFKGNPKTPIYIYVNPRVLEKVPVGKRPWIGKNKIYRAIRDQDDAFFRGFAEDVNQILLFLSQGKFGVELKELSFKSLTPLRGKMEEYVDAVTAEEILDKRDKGFVILVGYPARSGSEYVGHGIIVGDISRLENPGTKLTKLKWVHEILQGLGMIHSASELMREGSGHLFDDADIYSLDNHYLGLIEQFMIGKVTAEQRFLSQGFKMKLSDWYIGLSTPARLRLGWEQTPPIHIKTTDSFEELINRLRAGYDEQGEGESAVLNWKREHPAASERFNRYLEYLRQEI